MIRPSFPRIVSATVLVLLIGGFFYYVLFWERQKISVGTLPSRPMPALALKTYEGKEVRTADFKGNPVLINAWASWCPFCKDELRDFLVLENELRKKGVVVFAINRGETPEAARAYADQLGSTTIQFLLDPEDSFYKSIGGFSMPETVFVDKAGNIVFHKRGPMMLEEMRRRVEDLFF